MQALGALGLFVFHLLPILEGAEAFVLNAAEMDEDIPPVGVQYEAEPLLRVKPFYGAHAHGELPSKNTGTGNDGPIRPVQLFVIYITFIEIGKPNWRFFADFIVEAAVSPDNP
jgi:hypothetical protein